MWWMDCDTASAGRLEHSHHVLQQVFEVVEVARKPGGGFGAAHAGGQGVEQDAMAILQDLVTQLDAMR